MVYRALIIFSVVLSLNFQSYANAQDQWKSIVRLVYRAHIKNSGRFIDISSGSGTIISNKGLILTNYHVVNIDKSYLKGILDLSNRENITHEIMIWMPQGINRLPRLQYAGSVLAYSQYLDMAIVKIERDVRGRSLPSDFPFISINNINTIKPGQKVEVYGYPAEQGYRLTKIEGNILGLRYDSSWIEVDSPFGPGFSGGAALNHTGELIGIPSTVEQLIPIDCLSLYTQPSSPSIIFGEKCHPRQISYYLRTAMLANGILYPLAPATLDITVQIHGLIVDSRTTQPVAGVTFIVLKPNITWKMYNGDSGQILESVITDVNGRFTLHTPLKIGRRYSIGWHKSGFRDHRRDNFMISATGKQKINLIFPIFPPQER